MVAMSQRIQYIYPSSLLNRNPIDVCFATHSTIQRLYYIFLIIIIIINMIKMWILSYRSPLAYTVKPQGWNLDQVIVVHANGGGYVKGIMYLASRNSLQGRFPRSFRATVVKSTMVKAIENRHSVILHKAKITVPSRQVLFFSIFYI